ncbi:MAG: hypothetical protein QME52_10550, partial [Bacteroidota bacterium]|nr:hypothetical protein [Bacteroidota bacterium]
MRKTLIPIILIILFFSLLSGCATTGALLKLKLGMTKEKVIDVLGKPDAARGSIRTKYDQVIEVWEYIKQKQNPYGGIPLVYCPKRFSTYINFRNYS